jgi:hypothetical protein
MLDGIYYLSKPLRIADTYVDSFRMQSDGCLASANYQSVYLSHGWSLVLEKEDAIRFEPGNSVGHIKTEVDAGAKVWFPFSDNFNMGVATREFLTQYIHPNFADKKIDKNEAVAIELNLAHPLNFKTLAKRRWQYATREFGRIMSFEPWRNRHDIYGDGVLRCVSRLMVPDLFKFVRLIE